MYSNFSRNGKTGVRHYQNVHSQMLTLTLKTNKQNPTPSKKLHKNKTKNSNKTPPNRQNPAELARATLSPNNFKGKHRYCSAATRHHKKATLKCQSPVSVAESTNALTNIEVPSSQRNQDKEKYREVCGKMKKQQKKLISQSIAKNPLIKEKYHRRKHKEI